MTNEQVHQIVEGAAEHAVKDVKARRSTWVAFVVLLLCILAAVAYYGPRLASVSSHAQEQDSRISDLIVKADRNANDANALADQVRRLGGTPIVVPAPAAPAGQPGAAGANGVNGRDGQSPPCLLTPAQCQGAAGQPGTAGTNGANGTNGTDGVDGKTPPCYAEPAQCRGTNGAPGQPGERGAPGPACPDGYEPRPAVITAPDGSTYQGVACVDPTTSRPPPTPVLPLPTN